MVLHATTPKPLPHRRLAADLRPRGVFECSCLCSTLFNNTVSADLSTLLFHHLPSHREIELTEYKRQSVTLCSKEFLFGSYRRGPGRMHGRLVKKAGDASEEMEMGRHFHVPAKNCCLRCDSTFPFLFSWWFFA